MVARTSWLRNATQSLQSLAKVLGFGGRRARGRELQKVLRAKPARGPHAPGQALKGRAKTSDALLGFVFGLPDGVAWNVLSFWRCHYAVKLPDNEGGNNTFWVAC